MVYLGGGTPPITSTSGSTTLANGFGCWYFCVGRIPSTSSLVPCPVKNRAMWYAFAVDSSSNSNTIGCLKSPRLLGLKSACIVYAFPAGSLITLCFGPLMVTLCLSESMKSPTESRAANRLSLTVLEPALFTMISVIFALSVKFIFPKSMCPCSLSKSEQIRIPFLSWIRDSL